MKPQKKPPHKEAFLFPVVRPGFEPGKAEPKSAVLPLHHRTKIWEGESKNFFE